MIKILRNTSLSLAVGAVIFFQTVSLKAGERVPIPEGVYYFKSASNVFGFESAWINPAGLSRYTGTGVLLMADYLDGDIAKSWGILLNSEESAMGFRKIHNPAGEDYKEYLLASGLTLGNLNLGGSYRMFKDAPGIYKNRHFWNLGILIKGEGKFTFGALFSNLNRGKIDGEPTEVEKKYSVSYRPFEQQLTLSVDVVKTSSISYSDADYTYSAIYKPHPALLIEGLIDSRQNFSIGLKTNLLRYFVGAQSSFDRDGGGRGTTLYAGKVDLKQPSLISWKKRRLAVAVSGGRSENPPRPIFGHKPQSFYQLVSNIYRAADDASIGEIILKLRNSTFGFAQAQEIREALKYFKSKNKTIVCHLSLGNNIGYYLASVADSILMPPVSQLNLVGLRAELTYYAGTLSKLGAELDIVKIGDYKTAPDRLTRTGSTEQEREQINRILDNLYDQFVNDIGQSRSLSADSVRKIIDNGPFTSAEALSYGLVQGLSYADEMHKNFLHSMPEISFRKYLRDTLINDGWPARPKIAVVVADGEINFSSRGMLPFSKKENATPKSLSRAFARASSDKNVKGIVFRVNSPGGFVIPGEEIFHAADKASRKKPLTISMANLAASGGYYIAMSGDRIFADAGTITGSIGIYGGKLNLKKLYEKIDLKKELYSRGKFSGMMSSMRPFTPDERKKQMSHIQEFYDYFVELVAENRKLSPDSIDNLARGRVWTGQEALSIGLVDEIGGLRNAIAYTAEKLNLKDYRVEFYPEKRPLFLLPGSRFLSSVSAFLGLGQSQGDNSDSDFQIEENGILARMPFDILIE